MRQRAYSRILPRQTVSFVVATRTSRPNYKSKGGYTVTIIQKKMTPSQPASKSADYRTRLYQRYVTEQMTTQVFQLRAALESGMPYYRRLVEKYFPNDRTTSVLDIGCGYGPLLYELKRANFTNIAGVDTSPEQVHAAHELGLDCVRQGDLARVLMDTADTSVDVVTAIDVIEHFTKDEIISLLDDAHRVLRPGGMLLLHVPNGEAVFPGKIFFGDFTHQVAFTSKSISQVGRACGFRSIECYEDKPIAHGVVSAARAFLWWLIRTRYRILNAIETGQSGGDLILSQNLLAICRK